MRCNCILGSVSGGSFLTASYTGCRVSLCMRCNTLPDCTPRGLTPGDFPAVCRQRTLLGESLSPERFLHRLQAECRIRQAEAMGGGGLT